MEKSVRKFVNDIGCSMCFDNEINEEQIQMRLSIMGKNWREDLCCLSKSYRRLEIGVIRIKEKRFLLFTYGAIVTLLW